MGRAAVLPLNWPSRGLCRCKLCQDYSFANYLTMGGINLRTVQTLLGHKDVTMTMRYSHLSPEHLREAVQNLDKSLTLKEGVREHLAQQSVT